jgi:allophanate hydrolase
LSGGVTEATAGYNAGFKTCSLEMLHWSQGLFSFVGSLSGFVDSLSSYQKLPHLVDDGTSPPQTPPGWDGDLTLNALAEAYRQGLSPLTLLEELYEKIRKYQEIDPAVWIHLVPEETAMAAAKELQKNFPDRTKLPPLFGVPFSVKDSIDIHGIPTTTACPPLAFIPTKSALVYDKVIEQGALFIGKTNLDQLATGLTGCRSPYGITKSVFDPEFISGGSSSGNAVSVGAGLVSFSLATDTAGSGRVPAAFNGVIGFKPTRGTLSAQGVTPACLSLDCVALMAANIEDVRTVWDICAGYDKDYIYAKSTPPIQRHVNSIGPQAKAFSFGIPPPEALAVCTPVYRRLFNEAVQTLQSIGGVFTQLDWDPFEKAGKLLYDGTFVSERLASLPDGWLETNRAHLHPVILEIFEKVTARNSTAVQAYRDLQAKALYVGFHNEEMRMAN